MRVLLDDDGDVIKELSLCYGGMASHTVMATNTAAKLIARCDIQNYNYDKIEGPLTGQFYSL